MKMTRCFYQPGSQSGHEYCGSSSGMVAYSHSTGCCPRAICCRLHFPTGSGLAYSYGDGDGEGDFPLAGDFGWLVISAYIPVMEFREDEECEEEIPGYSWEFLPVKDFPGRVGLEALEMSVP